MTIRLDAVRSFGRNLKDWCRLTVPLICLARFLSDRPIDWLFFWIGWKFLQSSKAYLFDLGIDDGEKDDDRINSSKKETHDPRYRSRTKLSSTTRNAPSTGVSDTPISELPSTLMSAVASYLHPRDLLDLDTVLRTSNLTRHEYDNSVGHDVWKCLWYRDYGDVLLRWKISREAFRRSLKKQAYNSAEYIAHFDNNDSNSDSDCRLEEQLSKRLDEMARIPMPTTMKQFYFIFGECYIDYILAGKTRSTNVIWVCTVTYLILHTLQNTTPV